MLILLLIGTIILKCWELPNLYLQFRYLFWNSACLNPTCSFQWLICLSPFLLLIDLLVTWAKLWGEPGHSLCLMELWIDSLIFQALAVIRIVLFQHLFSTFVYVKTSVLNSIQSSLFSLKHSWDYLSSVAWSKVSPSARC